MFYCCLVAKKFNFFYNKLEKISAIIFLYNQIDVIFNKLRNKVLMILDPSPMYF